MRRIRRAPKDTLSAISEARAVERASNKPATLVLAISRMQADTPNRIHNGREKVRRNPATPLAPE